jgi:hypothetical protein
MHRRSLLIILALSSACAGGKPRAEPIPPALTDAARHPRFPASAFLTAIGYGRDRIATEADAKKRVSEIIESQILSECKSEQSAGGPGGERDVSECKTRVISTFDKASLIRIDDALTREVNEEWRSFAYLDRAKAEEVLAQDQKPAIEQLLTLWEKGTGAGPDALQADCEAERLRPEVKRGLAIRRSLVGQTADAARINAAEQDAARRRGERSGRAEVALVATDDLGKKAARAMNALLRGAQFKVRESSGDCALGIKLEIAGQHDRRDTSIGQLCTVTVGVTASYCGEAREGFTLLSEPSKVLNASDGEMACRKAEEKLQMEKLAQDAVQRVKGALGFTCEARP